MGNKSVTLWGMRVMAISTDEKNSYKPLRGWYESLEKVLLLKFGVNIVIRFDS